MIMNLRDALAKIEELEEQIADLEMEKSDLEVKVDRLEQEIEGSWIPVSAEDLEDLPERIFLQEIGFDPDRLPSSVGERMDIRSRLESPIPDLSQALDECQEQYSYLEKHYDRAFELGYDPITKDFYCRACVRAGRED
jgi:chromosome segregation ATPase